MKAYENDFSKLYQIVPGRQSRSVSSYDLTGGNDDGFCLTNSVTAQAKVLLEAQGPGVVNRIFVGGYVEHMTPSVLEIFIDGETTPTVSLSYADLFGGKTAPFLSPWVGCGKDSGGGVYTHMPIYFQKHIKITQTYASYYDIDYTLFPIDYQVESFSMTEAPVLPDWYAAPVGENPNLGVYEQITTAISLHKGATTLYRAEGPGILRGIVMDIGEFHAYTAEQKEALVQNLTLNVYYDGKETPDVSGTVGMLLGMGEFGYCTVRGLSQGATADGKLYFYLPMPYEKNIRVTLTGGEALPEDVAMKVTVYWEALKADTDFSNIGYLKTQHHVYAVCQEGIPISILKTAGAGKLVGVVQSLCSKDGWGHLEGDEVAYINGSKSHAIHGTGTEDFYGGAWYYVDGPFTNAFSGCTVLQMAEDKSTKHNAYRFLTYDPVYFDNGIDMTIEHGCINNAKDTHANLLSLYYHVEKPLARMVADGVVSTVVEGTGTERTVPFNLEAYYRKAGGYGTVTERLLFGTSQIQITLEKPSKGLLLRRCFLMDEPRQGATIFVNGKRVGNWINPFNRGDGTFMRYDDFYIPQHFVAGEKCLIIGFQTLNGYRFGETNYQIYSYDE